ncbi:hypothetical protein NDU88_002608 [Pleurodeles waltl]|uniref:Uncharacterized protein n=1 Tax=Pleurodeles waltl TaxID=8319 RepID=A0AAV7MBH6_PLEWA|nr:hypothetical protein NDU88_002608 [Pleurodeles waltl]
MLQWSSNEDEGGPEAGEGGLSESEEPLAYRAQGAPRWVYGATKKGDRFEEVGAGLGGEVQPREGGGFALGQHWFLSAYGTPDLVWQDPLDFEEEDPSEYDVARSPWEEAKAGPGAAGWMSSTGRRGGRREAADTSSGLCGGVGFVPPDAAAWEEQCPGPSDMRERSTVVSTACVVCGGCGTSGAVGVAARQDVESEGSLEEGELGNSGSEAEWWELGKGRGDANPVHKSFQVAKHVFGRPGGRQQ